MNWGTIASAFLQASDVSAWPPLVTMAVTIGDLFALGWWWVWSRHNRERRILACERHRCRSPAVSIRPVAQARLALPLVSWNGNPVADWFNAAGLGSNGEDGENRGREKPWSQLPGKRLEAAGTAPVSAGEFLRLVTIRREAMREMALELLRTDPDGFNAWRHNTRYPPLWLAGADLSNLDLRGVDWRDCTLVNTRLDGSDLRDCQFQGAHFWKTSFAKAIVDPEDLPSDAACVVGLPGRPARRATAQRTTLSPFLLVASLGHEYDATGRVTVRMRLGNPFGAPVRGYVAIFQDTESGDKAFMLQPERSEIVECISKEPIDRTKSVAIVIDFERTDTGSRARISRVRTLA